MSNIIFTFIIVGMAFVVFVQYQEQMRKYKNKKEIKNG